MSYYDDWEIVENENDYVLLPTPDIAISFIEERMNAHNIEGVDCLSRVSGVDVCTLNNLFSKKKVPIEALDKIYDALNIRTTSYPLDLVDLS